MFLACRQTLEILFPCCARDRWVAWWVPSALCKSLELVHDLYLLFGAAECLARQDCGSCVTSKVLHVECTPYLRAPKRGAADDVRLGRRDGEQKTAAFHEHSMYFDLSHTIRPIAELTPVTMSHIMFTAERIASAAR